MGEMRTIAVGIDVGGSGIKAAAVDAATGKFVSDRIRVPTPQPSTPASVIAAIARIVRRIEMAVGSTDLPIGVDFPAVIIGGKTMTAANVDPEWVGYPAAEHLGRVLGRPVTLVNDADAAGLAEMRLGAGVGRRGVVLVLTLGTGVGSGLFVDGVLVPNTELGHMEIRGRDAERRSAAAARIRRGISWKAWAADLDEHLQAIDRILWPDLVILGGGVSKNADRFIPRLTCRPPVVPAVLRNEAGMVGAAMFAIEASAAPGAAGTAGPGEVTTGAAGPDKASAAPVGAADAAAAPSAAAPSAPDTTVGDDGEESDAESPDAESDGGGLDAGEPGVEELDPDAIAWETAESEAAAEHEAEHGPGAASAAGATGVSAPTADAAGLDPAAPAIAPAAGDWARFTDRWAHVTEWSAEPGWPGRPTVDPAPGRGDAPASSDGDPAGADGPTTEATGRSAAPEVGAAGSPGDSPASPIDAAGSPGGPADVGGDGPAPIEAGHDQPPPEATDDATGAATETASAPADDAGDEHRPSWWSRANPFRS